MNKIIEVLQKVLRYLRIAVTFIPRLIGIMKEAESSMRDDDTKPATDMSLKLIKNNKTCGRAWVHGPRTMICQHEHTPECEKTTNCHLCPEIK